MRCACPDWALSGLGDGSLYVSTANTEPESSARGDGKHCYRLRLTRRRPYVVHCHGYCSPHPLKTPFLIYAIQTLGFMVALMTIRTPVQAHQDVAAAPNPGPDQNQNSPRQSPLLFAVCAIAISCAYAANGLFQSVIPLFARAALRSSDLIAASYAILMLGISAVAQLTLKSKSAQGSTRWGLLVLASGLLFCGAGSLRTNIGLLTVGTIITGIGNGLAFRGSLTWVTHSAASTHQSRTTSRNYFYGYAATAAAPLCVAAVESVSNMAHGLFLTMCALAIAAITGARMATAKSLPC